MSIPTIKCVIVPNDSYILLQMTYRYYRPVNSRDIIYDTNPVLQNIPQEPV